MRNLRGLALTDARRIARQLIFRDGALGAADLPELAKLKFELLNKQRPPALRIRHRALRRRRRRSTRLKRWVEQRRERRSSAATPPPGLDPPKGVLLLGVQGCGKSLAAKAVAGGFGVPLVRLDFGTLYNKFHGETEKNLREALASAEQLAPCVLWIDEIEKGLAADGGDERRRRVAARARLPADLDGRAQVARCSWSPPPTTCTSCRRSCCARAASTRSSSSTCPTPPTRAEIFRLHLRKRELDVGASSTLPRAGRAPATASPAPRSSRRSSRALYAAHAERAPLDEPRCCAEIRGTRPLSVLMAEQVAGAARVGARADGAGGLRPTPRAKLAPRRGPPQSQPSLAPRGR